MLRVLEIVGLLGPVIGLVLLIRWRRTIPARAFALGLVGASAATLSTVAAVIGGRVVWFAGVDAALRHLATIAVARWVLLLAGIVALSVAALIGRAGRPRPGGWLAAAWGLVLTGPVLRFLASGAEHAVEAEHDGLAVLVGMLGEAAEIAALSLGVVAACVAVAARRREEDDAGARVREMTTGAWRVYRDLRDLRDLRDQRS